jgi:hypothetical protein
MLKNVLRLKNRTPILWKVSLTFKYRKWSMLCYENLLGQHLEEYYGTILPHITLIIVKLYKQFFSTRRHGRKKSIQLPTILSRIKVRY